VPYPTPVGARLRHVDGARCGHARGGRVRRCLLQRLVALLQRGLQAPDLPQRATRVSRPPAGRPNLDGSAWTDGHAAHTQTSNTVYAKHTQH